MNKTPIKVYQRNLLKLLKMLWKSKNYEMWKRIYTFIKYYTQDERRVVDGKD